MSQPTSSIRNFTGRLQIVSVEDLAIYLFLLFLTEQLTLENAVLLRIVHLVCVKTGLQLCKILH